MAILFLFDIDGTLLRFKSGESRKIFSRMMKEVFGKEILHTDMPDFAGKTDLQILKDISAKHGIPFRRVEENLPQVWDKILTFFKDFCNHDYIYVLPGIRELLDLLEDDDETHSGLLTGNFRENAYLKLSTFNLDKYFPFGAFGSDHENRNLLPPIAIERANKYAGYEKFSLEKTVIIGDSPKDVECARANGLPVVCVGTGWCAVEELTSLQPDYFFDDLSDTEKAYKSFKNIFNSK